MQRRDILKSGLLAGFATSTIAGLTKAASAQSTAPGGVTYVMVHGSWHGAWCWATVTPHLVASGHSVLAIDLPGDGMNAKFPASWSQRPLDMAAFGTERSHVADFTTEDYVAAVIDAVDLARAGGAERVILVGHSLAGIPITFAGEEITEKVDALVYVAACLIPPGKTMMDYFMAPEQADHMSGDLVLGDPAVIGAARWDPRSSDPEYLAKIKAAFAHDVDGDVLAAALNMTTPDATLAMHTAAPAPTRERFGSLQRIYVRLSEDWILRPAAQDLMISDNNAAFPGNPVEVFEIASSHEVMLSKPEMLAEVLAQIA